MLPAAGELVVPGSLDRLAAVDVDTTALVGMDEAPSPTTNDDEGDDEDDDEDDVGEDEDDTGVAVVPVHAPPVDCSPDAALALDPSTVIAVAVPTSAAAVTVVAP